MRPEGVGDRDRIIARRVGAIAGRKVDDEVFDHGGPLLARWRLGEHRIAGGSWAKLREVKLDARRPAPRTSEPDGSAVGPHGSARRLPTSLCIGLGVFAL